MTQELMIVGGVVGLLVFIAILYFMFFSSDDLVVKGNIIMRHPNGDEWVIGMRDTNHFAINKLDKTGKNINQGAGILIRNDGASFNGPIDENWHKEWQHNIHKGRR
jgi:hypothetical protein